MYPQIQKTKNYGRGMYQPNEFTTMKRKNYLYLLLLLASSTLFVQCKKSATDEQPVGINGLKGAANQQAKANFFCADCQESNAQLTGPEADQLGSKFAPLMKFDRAAPEYPSSIENVFANTKPESIVCGGKLQFQGDPEERSKNFPTYYDVQLHPNNANRVFIEYWWAYKRQRACFVNLGGHDYDLEHVVVQVNRQTQQLISVTYFQHKGWYTKKPQGTPQENGRIVSYVGKIAHGMYHDKKSASFGQCLYYEDYRNPKDSNDEVQSSNNLVKMTCNINQFAFNGDWGIGRGPLFRDREYWKYAACGDEGNRASDWQANSKLGDLNP